ncbi:unnamed protein product (macronuclear) [Paramecium tetraurelia]|uniref:Uncharacterized protein n=1 Tax=Paramecium tetraurelia TaxID=5888 RepID=A0EI46_PARTE|nr:uncharacterized protein GSPATT00027314001 [Paramecium tetraurelia]CAK94987.1 unnamed protein product [Paramecium tetraurelia]|eukprot:XP_001462360.1 hypothetical protein (macronuclear) [Paramecium tetraurelia strain d4-2]
MGCSLRKSKPKQRDDIDQIEQLIQSDCLGMEQNYALIKNPIVMRRNCSKEKQKLSDSKPI